MNLFNGKKIIGSPNLSRKHKKDQVDPQILFDALDKVLSYPFVKSVNWSQYTPYFNDGSICEFGVNKATVEFKFDIEESEDIQTEYSSGLSAWDLSYYKDRVPAIGNLDPQFLEDFDAFNTLLVNGTNEDILYETFGDHAEITATQENIVIDECSHD
jgi:hypothetical protein